MLFQRNQFSYFPIALGILFFGAVFLFFSFNYYKLQDIKGLNFIKLPSVFTSGLSQNKIEKEDFQISNHIKIPENIKAIYISSWVAGNKELRKRLIDMIDETELNAVVIDIKDSSGRVAFKTDNKEIVDVGSIENRIPDIDHLIALLHEKNIYIIGRIAVFQDPYLAKKYPDIAVKKNTNKEEIWRDKNNLSWIDVGGKESWDYVVSLAKESYSRGFDELNFDYIRFPTDGDMSDIYFPISNNLEKEDILEKFFVYLNLELKKLEIPISADLFGFTMNQSDDMDIGQILEKALPYFDFICPMVYPSHYPNGWYHFENPADNPYEIISIALKKGVERTILAGYDKNKIRPWLQDFDYKAIYTKEMVRAQIEASYDAGLSSWALWDPKNQYTREALLEKLEISS